MDQRAQKGPLVSTNTPHSNTRPSPVSAAVCPSPAVICQAQRESGGAEKQAVGCGGCVRLEVCPQPTLAAFDDKAGTRMKHPPSSARAGAHLNDLRVPRQHHLTRQVTRRVLPRRVRINRHLHRGGKTTVK